ncbi:hypothetical protein NXY41_06265 [Bacteroides fragilis]|uniref:hypothetical protein n=1 Tax=Bacteroides sp. TaxID=29523 RepID=UPI002A3108EC|nr:hypothetical protein [Bacteroides sp.]MCS2612597.1 hypothetical protein [Bacteroides fragilis]MCS2688447.1 hypothetical protein [Bacteroides fragilis]MCS2878198.1 hypothetical protein [Bacteroides fragilis]MCS3204248.1 hypothetical protein [Bacteroides fragilis]MDY3137617.1 hypothetical protein [Bacteroides sp.]
MYVIIGCKSNSFIGFSVFFHYLFLHLRSHSRRNSDVDMQALLNDIELDIQELKCLMEAVSRKPDSALREVAKRNIVQMRGRLDILLEQLDRGALPENELPDRIINPMPEPVSAAAAAEEEEEEEEEIVVGNPEKDEEPVIVPEAPEMPESEQLELPEVTVEPAQSAEVSMKIETNTASTPILAERIKTTGDLRRLISLNDSFRFSRELFGGSMEQMNHVLQQIGEMHSLDAALVFLSSKIKVEEENEAKADLVELLKKYFI